MVLTPADKFAGLSIEYLASGECRVKMLLARESQRLAFSDLAVLIDTATGKCATHILPQTHTCRTVNLRLDATESMATATVVAARAEVVAIGVGRFGRLSLGLSLCF